MFFAGDGSAGAGGTGERHQPDLGMADQRLAGPLAGAGNDVEDVFGEHRVQQLNDADDRERSLLAGLQDDGVADGEGRSELATGVDRRPVERDDLTDHAEGLEVGGGVDDALVVEVGRQLVGQAAEEAEDADQEVDVVLPRVLDELPVLA